MTGDATQTRDFVFVGDVARDNVAAAITLSTWGQVAKPYYLSYAPLSKRS
jgi:hypothetical protein